MSTSLPSKSQSTDESILKSALAFVVLKRRLKAKQNGLPSFSSSLLQQQNDDECKCAHTHTHTHTGSSTKISSNDNDVGNRPTSIGITCTNCSSNKTTDNHEEEEALPFLRGKFKLHNRNTNSNSNGNNNLGSKRHLETMLQVAKSTSLALYSKCLTQQQRHKQTQLSTSSISGINASSNNIHNHNTSSNSRSSSSSRTHIVSSTSSSSSSSVNQSKLYSFIYDFKTASNKSFHSKLSSSSSSYHHSYAVLDGILLHITSTLRSSSCTTKNTYQNNSYSTLFKFIISNFLQSHQFISIIQSNHFNNYNHDPKYQSLSSSTTFCTTSKQKQYYSYIQSVLSTCTIIHRLVLLDTSLSFHCMIILCKLLKFLYYDGVCGDSTCSEITREEKEKEDETDLDDEYDYDDGQNYELFQDIVNVLCNGYTYKQRSSSSSINDFVDDYDDNQQQPNHTQIQDILTVNILILLEQIIGMSILYHSNTTTATTTSSQSKENIICHILSILNKYLGPEMMIPVATNDMAKFYITQEENQNGDSNRSGVFCTRSCRKRKSHRDLIVLEDDGDDNIGKNNFDDHNATEQDEVFVVVMHHKLNAGAKMMLRLYIYDIVQKLSFHNTTQA